MIRLARADDADAIVALCARAARAAYAGLVSPDFLDRTIAHFYEPTRIRREIPPSPGWFGFVVATCDDVVAGVAGTGQSAEQPETCELFTLYVDQAFQRRGIGRALVADSVTQAAQAGATSLDVAAMPGNEAAVRFYQTCGFSFTGERPIYAPHGEEGGPPVALVYTILLPSAPVRAERH